MNIINRLIDNYSANFAPAIIERGNKYYEEGRVLEVLKSNNTYHAKVEGSDIYGVEITINPEEKEIYCTCDCPCDYPCKHLYATLLVIKNNQYKEIELKPEIAKKCMTMEEFLTLIPAENIKKYLLAEGGLEHIHFDTYHLEKCFSSYLPSQPYKYYYNNLYNKIILNNDYKELLAEYLDAIKTSINNKKFNECFHIIMAIIESASDANIINKWYELLDNFPFILMSLKIVARRCDTNTKQEMFKWIEKVVSYNYYDSIFLEEVMLELE